MNEAFLGRGERNDALRNVSRSAPVVAEGTWPSGKVLGLDVSSVCVGWAVFENGRPRWYGKYRQEGKGHGERLANFADWLVAHLKLHSPQHVVVEKPYSGRRRNAFGVLSMYYAVVLLAHVRWSGDEILDENCVEAHLVKRALGARKGKTHEARKKAMVLLMNQLYALKLKFKHPDAKKRISDDDIADAIALLRAWSIRRVDNG